MPFRALLLSCLFSSFLISNPAFAQTISGSVLDIHGNPQGGVVRLYDPSNNFAGEFGLDHLGNYQTEPLADGTYFAVTMFTDELIDEAWDNVPCENLLCNILASSPIVVAGGDRTGIDFVLDPILVGGHISGLVTDGSDVPLPYVPLLIRNSDGEHIDNAHTDAGGNYQTALLADDSYFVHTAGEPVGLGRELYDNIPCLPGDTCWDTAYVKANGTAVIINGADESGIDFKLEVPAGGLISGQVTDADTGIPLPDVHMDLLNQFGVYMANTDTDQFGNYYFSGLANGNYKVIAINVPEGYTIELFGGDHCANLECNLTTAGTIITIVGGGVASGKDIVLDYSGTRLLGTITRSDSGAPVSSFDAHVSADLYDAAGDFIGSWPTNRAGQYQIHLAGAGSYYLVAVNDWDKHGLINEAWDDIQCSTNCDPLDNGATLIPVAEGTTVVADFELDPSFIISGTIQFEGSPTGEGEVNIWDDGGNYVANGWNDGGGNWMSDRLPAGTYYATARGEDWGRISQLYNGLACPQEYCDITAGTPIVLSDSDFAGVNFNLMALSEDWTISGSILDSDDNPIGGAIKLFGPFNNPVGDFGTDHLGNFHSHPLADGTYFAITVSTHEILDEAWDDVPCENMLCDILSSTPIVINGADRSGIDFVLEPVLIGGRISGQVKDFSNAPLPDVIVQIRNSNGDYLFEEWTDADGNYQTPLLADDNYFANTLNEPFGLGSELYDDIPCLPADLCGDSAYVAANGTAVMVDGADETGIDFKLVVPAGGMITGQVTDQDTGISLPDVHMNVLDPVGNYVANTNTDPTGVYYFSGLADGDYKVIAIVVPQGYSSELYGGDHCPDWQCDLTTAGDIINITGGAVAGGNDISLDYAGTRVLGTITRSDSGDPVSAQYAHVGVDLISEANEYLGTWGTNQAGQYQITLPGAGSYYLVATNDWNFHGLVNEVWDDFKCYEFCDPIQLAATLIPVAEGTTVVADFVLDPGFTISGAIQHEGIPAGAGHVNIWDGSGQFVMGAGTDGGGNWMTGPLAAGGYYATTRGEEFGMVSQLYDGVPCPQEFCDVTSGTEIVLSDSDATGINFNLAAISADWTISGSVRDSGDNPIGGGIKLFDPFNNLISDFPIDPLGNFQTHPLADGTYFAITVGTYEVLDEAWDNFPCENMLCDIPASTPIVISGADRSGIDFVLDPIVNGGHISGQVTDGSGAPLADIGLNIYSSNFEYLFSISTDAQGNYRTPLQSSESYYIHTMNEPLGLGRELYDDVHCFLPDRCSRWWFIRNRGTPVVVDGGDVSGIDFMLEVPEGGLISGRVSDADIGIALPDVHMNLLDPSGNYLRNTNTDATGHYYFSGLGDGDYKVIAIGVPHPRYSGELYGGEHCSEFNCDLTTAGTVINISGGAMASGKDIALDYEGTRLLGTITRSDTGEPVSSQYGFAGVDAYLETGEFFRYFETNRAGQFSLHPTGGRSYYLVAVSDMNTHGLLAEAWDNIRCVNDCNPLDMGAILIEVPENTTVVRDFILDPEVAFKNGFE